MHKEHMGRVVSSLEELTEQSSLEYVDSQSEFGESYSLESVEPDSMLYIGASATKALLNDLRDMNRQFFDMTENIFESNLAESKVRTDQDLVHNEFDNELLVTCENQKRNVLAIP